MHSIPADPIPEGTDPGWKSRYRDVPNSPLYPFGYGLSYTTFAYSNLSFIKATRVKKDNIRVSVTVTNSGTREGEEVVTYIRDMAASIIRPVKALKVFRKYR